MQFSSRLTIKCYLLIVDISLLLVILNLTFVSKAHCQIFLDVYILGYRLILEYMVMMSILVNLMEPPSCFFLFIYLYFPLYKVLQFY